MDRNRQCEKDTELHVTEGRAKYDDPFGEVVDTKGQCTEESGSEEASVYPHRQC